MQTIPLTRYHLARFGRGEKQRCENAQAFAMREYDRIHKEDPDLLVTHQLLQLAHDYIETGRVLFDCQLYSLSADHYSRAYLLLERF